MPTTSCGFGSPYELTLYGPTLAVEIGFDAGHREDSGIRPELSSGLLPALVDTGATESCIDSQLAATLNLPIVNHRAIAGVGGITVVNVHLAQIYVPQLGWTINGRFDGVHLAAGRQRHYALIGRTFLRHFNMNYDGQTGVVILTNE